jgi:mono/diheme cytochrome c family protein
MTARRSASERTAALLLPLSMAFAAGCSGFGAEPAPPGEPAALPWASLPAVTHVEPELQALGSRAETYQRLCARGRSDSFAAALCSGPNPPELRDIVGLLELAGLQENRAFALTANSTSLVAKAVSAINPRILVFPRVGADLQPPPAMTAFGFVRGEQVVELVSRDATGDLNFYLLTFEQRCSYEPSGCDLASLLTEQVERDWTAYSIYDQEDLEGTSFDCLSCHQTGGYGSKRILRMQELASPWMHWFPQRFVQRTESDRVLGAIFAETHRSDTQYGGITLATITGAVDEGSGAQLEALLRAEKHDAQPNEFDGQIAREMSEGSSPTWQARFDTHLKGEAIIVPYPLLDVTDAAKRAAAVRSYQDVTAGVAPRESLLDIRDVFSDDAARRLSFVPQPGADGKTVLLQMCSRCHDGRGNPALAKNQFDVRKLDQMPRALKDLAIARMSETGELRMPPWRSGTLTPESIQAATEELRK